jgi:hypothetical protein
MGEQRNVLREALDAGVGQVERGDGVSRRRNTAADEVAKGALGFGSGGGVEFVVYNREGVGGRGSGVHWEVVRWRAVVGGDWDGSGVGVDETGESGRGIVGMYVCGVFVAGSVGCGLEGEVAGVEKGTYWDVFL